MFTVVARPGVASFFVAVALASVLTASRTPIAADARVSLRAAELWLRTGSMALEPNDFRLYNLLPSSDGKRYSKYPLLAFVQSVPAAFLLAHFAHVDAAVGCSLLALVPALWTAWLALGFALLAAELGVAWRDALLASTLLVLGTPLWVYAHSYYGEISQAACLIWTLLAAQLATRDVRWAVIAGLGAGLALAAKPSFAILIPCVALALPRTAWPRLALGLAVPLALVATYNLARYQNPLAFGYGGGRDGTLGFSTPLYVGLFGNLLSPGKSVFLYAPLLLLLPRSVAALWPQLRERARFWLWAWAVPVLAQLVLISKWWAWSGDLAWGPRLLTPLLPWLALPVVIACAAPSRGRRAFLSFVGLAGLGALVQLPAILLSEAPYLQQLWHQTHPALLTLTHDPSNVADDTLLAHYVPWMSPVVAQWWLLVAKLLGMANAGTPPWAGNHFDALSAAPDEPSWNFWFDGSPAAWIVASVLGAACVALSLHLLRVTACASNAQSLLEGALPETPR